jgi:hypothetical protein
MTLRRQVPGSGARWAVSPPPLPLTVVLNSAKRRELTGMVACRLPSAAGEV